MTHRFPVVAGAGLLLRAVCTLCCIAGVCFGQAKFEFEPGLGLSGNFGVVGLRCADFSPDSRLLAVPSGTGKVVLWDLDEGCGRATIDCRRNVGALQFSPDGKVLVAFALDDTRRTPDARRLVFCDMATLQAREHVLGRRGGLSDLSFSPDGKLLVAAVAQEAREQVTVFELATAREVRKLDDTPVGGGVAFSPDGRWLATAHALAEFKGHVVLWDAHSFERRRVLKGIGGPMQVGFSPDSRLVVAAYGHHDTDTQAECGIRIWDVETGKEREWIGGFDGPVRHHAWARFTFSPRGAQMVATSYAGPSRGPGFATPIRVRELATGQETVLDTSRDVLGVCFSHNGQLLATPFAAERGVVKLWDTKYWRVERTLPLNEDEHQKVVDARRTVGGLCSAFHMSFSPDDRWFAAVRDVTGRDGTAQTSTEHELVLWNLADGDDAPPKSLGQ